MKESDGMKETVILAYSGGLDTSVAIRWLQERYGMEVVALAADLGQPGDLEALLGQPDLERQERQAQYRRYDVDGCALDLYLYEAPSNGAPKVAWFEVRPADPLAALDPRTCAWLEERLGAPSLQERRAEQARS